MLPGLTSRWGAGQAMQALLAGLSPADLPTSLAALLLVALMTLGGSLLPALRAARVNPMTVMRTE